MGNKRQDDQDDDVVRERQAEDDPEDQLKNKTGTVSTITAAPATSRPTGNGLRQTAKKEQHQRPQGPNRRYVDEGKANTTNLLAGLKLA